MIGWMVWREPKFPPLPVGERSARFARRVRGKVESLDAKPPHPSPLPTGERGDYSGMRLSGSGVGTTVSPGVVGRSRLSGAFTSSPLAFHQVEA